MTLTLGRPDALHGFLEVVADERPVHAHWLVQRAERGYSQAGLAEKLDVSRQMVNAIETQKCDPSLPLAFKIAGLFGTRIEEIFQPNPQA